MSTRPQLQVSAVTLARVNSREQNIAEHAAGTCCQQVQ